MENGKHEKIEINPLTRSVLSQNTHTRAVSARGQGTPRARERNVISYGVIIF